MNTIAICTETIRLGQFLKLANAVGSGAEAKIRIQGGEVRVNGETETRRGRQLRAGDQVELARQVYMVAAGDE